MGKRRRRHHRRFATVQATAPSAHVVVVGPFWPYPDESDQMWSINAVVREAATDAGVDFIDTMSDDWIDDPATQVQPDGLHPSDTGHRVIADRLANELRALGF